MKWACRFVTSLLAVAMLFGCATAYQKRGLTGGYHETKVDDSHYVVYFDGNGYAGKDRVWYFWIYRCAQLTRERGYTYFSLAPVQASMNKTAFDPDDDGHAYPAVLTGDANGHVIDVHAGGGGGGGGHFIYVPGGVGTIVSWHSKAMVSMYGHDVPARTFVLRAQSVLDALGEYIRTDGSSMPPDRTAIAHEAMYAVAPDNTIVNVYQYLLAHVHPAVASAPYAYVTPSPTIQPERSGMAVPPPPPPAVIANAATPATTAPDTVLGAATDALNARPAMAQSIANQLGCGAVQANGNATYVASCGSYSVLISCSGSQCRPMHTISAKSNH